jgi:peroxiredoxin
MALNLDVGDRFPDVMMPNHDGDPVAISEIAKGQPLFLAFFRGPW